MLLRIALDVLGHSLSREVCRSWILLATDGDQMGKAARLATAALRGNGALKIRRHMCLVGRECNRHRGSRGVGIVGGRGLCR